MAKITFIGTGYVGLVSGTCMVEIGHDVICVDKDVSKIKLLANGEIPIYEPELDKVVKSNIANGRLTFTSNLSEAVIASDYIFIAVGTPQSETGQADLSQVFSCIEEIKKDLSGAKYIITKSTVPVGTGKKIEKLIANDEISVCSNPEFLREGNALKDFMQPDRIIIGSNSENAADKVGELYSPLVSKTNAPIILTSLETAELIKYSSNAFLATKVAFINEIADLCEASGADVTQVSLGMGLDERIGSKFLNPGPGIGGSCFPKDTKALVAIGKEYGAEQNIVKTVVKSNDDRKTNCGKKVKRYLNGDLNNKKIAVLGVTFKANTDDLRASPALEIINYLLSEGAIINLHDPQGLKNAKKLFGNRISYNQDLESNLIDVDAAVIVTEWNEYKDIDFEGFKTPILIDFRNLYTPTDFINKNIKYYPIGR